MAPNDGKPAIPAWQRSQQPIKSVSKESEQGEAQNESRKVEPEHPEDAASTLIPSRETTSMTANGAKDDGDACDQVKAFLEDPAIRDESSDKKRVFLEQKGIPDALIDQELGPEPATLKTDDFAAFQRASQPPAAPVLSQRPSAPPIITYPEFLSQAHKPAPLITPTRVLNTAYLASGLAALIYGASTFLVNPMSASLTEARHDFSTHSQNKLDEFNERLSKLASKVPETKKSKSELDDDDDVESITSDPTELYHRDMGTQTSPPPSRRPSTPGSGGETKSTLDKHNDRLAILQSHLSETLAGIESGEEPAKERQDSVNDLRHYLDTLMYRTQAINVWGMDGAAQKNGEKEKDDAIEELKKEIRGVKGVLLSARRFAPVNGVVRVGK